MMPDFNDISENNEVELQAPTIEANHSSFESNEANDAESLSLEDNLSAMDDSDMKQRIADVLDDFRLEESSIENDTNLIQPVRDFSL